MAMSVRQETARKRKAFQEKSILPPQCQPRRKEVKNFARDGACSREHSIVCLSAGWAVGFSRKKRESRDFDRKKSAHDDRLLQRRQGGPM